LIQVFPSKQAPLLAEPHLEASNAIGINLTNPGRLRAELTCFFAPEKPKQLVFFFGLNLTNKVVFWSKQILSQNVIKKSDNFSALQPECSDKQRVIWGEG